MRERVFNVVYEKRSKIYTYTQLLVSSDEVDRRVQVERKSRIFEKCLQSVQVADDIDQQDLGPLSSRFGNTSSKGVEILRKAM